MIFIILVNYNGFEDTAACIRSLQAVRSPAFRLIVVDNGGTDGSPALLRAFRAEYPFELIEAGGNRGFSAGNNLGIRSALSHGADHVLLLNNDTLVTEGFLQGLLSAFSEFPRCGASTCLIRYAARPDTVWYAGGSVSARTGRTRHFGFGQRVPETDGSARPVTFASGCCLCLSREAVQKTGLLDEDYFLYEEDADYCLRLLQAGFEIIYVPSAVIFHKVSASVRRLPAGAGLYPVRNKYLLIQKRLPPARRPAAFLFCTARLLVRCLKGEYTFHDLRKGIAAFRAGEKGKTSFS